MGRLTPSTIDWLIYVSVAAPFYFLRRSAKRSEHNRIEFHKLDKVKNKLDKDRSVQTHLKTYRI